MKPSFEPLIEHLVESGFFLEEAVEILEKGVIERVLRRTEGNQSEAAKVLGIHRNTLLRKMVQYDIGGKRVQPRPAGKAGSEAAATRRRRAAS
jgi:DNA-binding NtrC family response regulator